MFTQAGAEVVGISNDQPEALIEFVKSQRLNFPLLSDEGGKLRKALKVKGAAGANLAKKSVACNCVACIVMQNCQAAIDGLQP